jgi:plastocyanin
MVVSVVVVVGVSVVVVVVGVITATFAPSVVVVVVGWSFQVVVACPDAAGCAPSVACIGPTPASATRITATRTCAFVLRVIGNTPWYPLPQPLTVSDGVSAQAADFDLDGDSDGWVGRSPEAIAGRTNPTLNLEPCRTYRVTWTNVDGAPHSFVIEDADGNRLAETEIADEKGASLTLEFEATSAMAEYYCEVHPESMRGQVAVGDGGIADEGTAEGGEATGETTADAETEPMTEDGPPPVIDEGTVVLGGQASHWLGLAPSRIQGRENPTLRLRAGRECELVWVNLDGGEHDFHLADAAGEDLADTSAREDVGDTHSTTFETTPEMAEYYCAFHRQSMRGSVEIV